ncbi:MAG TPA: hypothetical protein DEQ84_06290 [Prevotellaceae bacterium]|nr:hypothetical protein [Prevotellaceae bacterium]
MTEFTKWQRLHQEQRLIDFIGDTEGILWLKVKSIMRPELQKAFCKKYGIALTASTSKGKFEELYDMALANTETYTTLIDTFIISENEKLLKKLDADKLVSQLYKVQHFEWGGDNTNALDKYLVKHYVKDLSSYDKLLAKCRTEVQNVVQNYLISSWYNHWSSILIEHIFKSHKDVVLPAIGQIKNVDFFIHDVPLDLKVTYLPTEYQKVRRKALGLPVEMTFLKSEARRLGISFDKTAKEKQIEYEIVEKLRYSDNPESKEVLSTFSKQRALICLEAVAKSKLLMQWLYENQGEMRFSSENRLFLVLVDTKNMDESWKLKRDFARLKPAIDEYISNFNKDKLSDIKFTYKDKQYKAKADILFVIK